jgi:hypothetical protein
MKLQHDAFLPHDHGGQVIFNQDASGPKWIRGWVGPRTHLDAVPGIEHRFLGGVDRSGDCAT